MSQEDDLFHNEYTFQRQDGNQRSSDTISIRTGPVDNPSETEYDEFKKYFIHVVRLFPNQYLFMNFFPSSKLICLGK